MQWKENWRRRGEVLMAVILVAGSASELRAKNLCRKPDYIRAMKEQAVVYYRNGNYVEALKSAKNAEVCHPKDAELYYWLGLIYYQKGKSYEAIDYLKQALKIDKNFYEANMALGVIYLGLERWDEAIAEFKSAADNDYFPRPHEAFSNMGWAYFKKGDLALAEVNLKQAIKLNDKYCPAYTNLGELYSKQGQRRQAIGQYQQAIALCPRDYARPHYLMAIDYGYLGLYDQACSELVIAILVPNAPEAEPAKEKLRLYNCPGVLTMPPGP